jgi:predicted Rossmann fold nucleotide-binding protein DprA/Smf involved in DNA uptake
VTVIGGFHSPMERECLNILLRSPHAVIVCPARGLPRRIQPEFKRPLTEGRLLLLSVFPDSIKRATVETTHQRNRVVAVLADKIFIAYAAPDSQTEFFAREVLGWRKPLFTFPDSSTKNLIELGARPISPADTVFAQLSRP